jgi:hypothetical protein
MALDTRFKQGDSLWSLTKKILDRLNDVVATSGGGGGGGGGGGAVTIANGADTAEGTTTDSAATDSTSAWTVVSLLKGLFSKLSGSLTVSGNVGGHTTIIKDTTVVSSSPAYTAGDAVGGKRTLSNALLSAHTGVLQSITVLDRANQKAPLDIFIFDADPTNATITDNAAFVFSTDDLKVIAHVTVNASDYVTVNSKAMVSYGSLGIALSAAGTTLYAAVVTSGTPTYAATTDVQVEFGFLQD